MNSTAGKRGRAMRESGRQRRLAIIEAALRVIAREGLRAVSHRAVAAEARVPLAATTYYFRDLADLITESFLHWSAEQRVHVERFHSRTLALLTAGGPAMPGLLADAVSEYVIEQVERLRGDRVLEYAFLHEAARMPALRSAVARQQAEFVAFLTDFHRLIGSPQPEVAAQISYSVLLGLEKSALLASGTERDDPAGLRAVVIAYLDGLFADPDGEAVKKYRGEPSP